MPYSSQSLLMFLYPTAYSDISWTKTKLLIFPNLLSYTLPHLNNNSIFPTAWIKKLAVFSLTLYIKPISKFVPYTLKTYLELTHYSPLLFFDPSLYHHSNNLISLLLPQELLPHHPILFSTQYILQIRLHCSSAPKVKFFKSDCIIPLPLNLPISFRVRVGSPSTDRKPFGI